jgi:hypothetical protein
MAGEILHSSLETDLRLADLIAGEVQILLADTFSIRDVPGALLNLGSINGRGSDTIRVPQMQIDALSATAAENTSVTNTALTDSSFTCAVVRHALVRELSDLANMTARLPGDADIVGLARTMVDGTNQAFMDSLAATMATLSSSVGSTGVNLSVDNWYSAVATLEIASNRGPFFAILHPTQWSDLQSSIRAESGVVEMRADHAEAVGIKGQGYAGSFLGVDIYVSSRVDTANAGADRSGAMFAAGCFAYGTGTPVAVPGAIMSQPTDMLTVEIQRPDRTGTSLVVGHSYFGTALAEDARGVSIVTDA